MNNVFSWFNALMRDADSADGNEFFVSGANPVNLDELIHELRQPLGVIESLTYFIELTTTDECIAPRLEHIQSMLVKIHHLLENASERGIGPDRMASLPLVSVPK
jgi:hypothetical protein